MYKINQFILFVICFCFLFGCQRKATNMMAYSEDVQADSRLQKKFRKSEARESFKMEPSAPASKSMDMQQNLSLNLETQPQVPNKSNQNRMIAYTGSIETRSSNADSLIELALEITTKAKGYLQSRFQTVIVIRIPAESFDTVYKTLLGFGEIVQYDKSAEDITSQFRDVSLRIEILKRTIERYSQLLSKIKEPNEKVQLLKEIARLQEELERLEISQKTMQKRVDYATITFSVSKINPVSEFTPQNEFVGFGWIHQLSPFTQNKIGKSEKILVPKGFVRIRKENAFYLESADGAKVWSIRVKNNPKGDTKFWVNSVKKRISQKFKSVDTISVHPYTVLRYTPYEGANYVYYVGITTVKKKVKIVQVFFPTVKEENRHIQSIRESLNKR